MSIAQLEHAQEQGRQRLAEAERQALASQRKAWKAAAGPIREWYEIEQVKGLMSLNARQNVEKLIGDMESGGR
jgi:hypothetical protein